jgi:hypothetical protein
MDLQQITDTVNKVTDVLNTFGDSNMNTFVHQMSFQHRTLQQSFTKLCMKWIEHCASDEYKFDGRNQQSHELCKEICEKMETKLSNHLSCI